MPPIPICAFTKNLPLLVSAGIICLEFDCYRGITENLRNTIGAHVRRRVPQTACRASHRERQLLAAALVRLRGQAAHLRVPHPPRLDVGKADLAREEAEGRQYPGTAA